ncbi:MAG: serine/threonine protein kinase [Candidatus Xenobiia bacterium LiM19]
MAERVPAPDGRMAADGIVLNVLPDGTILNYVYEVSYLTAGGMGIVYKGKKDNEIYCIKEVECSKLPRILALSQEKAMLERLNHPGIVKVLDCFDEDGYLYIVLEFIEGKSLGEILHVGGIDFIEESLLDKWSLQLYDIFEYLHSQNPPIIYRDLKPQNIMCRPDGRLCLIDFGIARVHKESKNADTYSMGTALTASPEHYGGKQTDVRSDIFTLGATLHYLSTNGKGVGKGFFEFIPVRTINPALSENFENIITKALQVHPEDRFQTIREMREAHIGASSVSAQLIAAQSKTVASSQTAAPLLVKTSSQPAASSQTAALSQTATAQISQSPSASTSSSGNAASPLFMRIPAAVVAAVFIVVSALIFLWAVLIMHSDQQSTADPRRNISSPVAEYPGTKISFNGCSVVIPPGYDEVREGADKNRIEYRKKDENDVRSLGISSMKVSFARNNKSHEDSIPRAYLSIFQSQSFHNEPQILNSGDVISTPDGYRLDHARICALSSDEEQADRGILISHEITVLVHRDIAYILVASADKKNFNRYSNEFKSFFESLKAGSGR